MKEARGSHWGIFYAAGPNYNMPWELYDPSGKAKALAASYDAMQKALACGGGRAGADPRTPATGCAG
jgi:hypothetical protein